MAEYDNTNRGVLFKNDRKEKDSHPDYKGQINVGGDEFWLSAWIKDGQKGKFMSISIQEKEQERAAPQSKQAAQPQRSGRPAPNFSDIDDDIPF